MKIEAVNSRLYVVGNSYAVKDKLKSIGCHWDSTRKQWWIGKTKKAELEQIVNGNQPQGTTATYTPPTPEELADKRCDGKVRYKDRAYFVVGKSERTGKLLLTVLDCKISFWAAESDCQWIKRYHPQERSYNYGRHTETVYQTVGKIRAFVEQKKEDDATLKAGRIPDGWCLDHEDGQYKPRHECDMPAN